MTSRWRGFRALRHRNFSLFLAGQLVSVAGSWMQQVALGWLVFRLTDSAFLLGLVGFCSQIPFLIVAPLAGVWADRVDKRRVVIAAQAAGMVQAFGLAGLVFSDLVTIPWVLALATLLGIANGIDVPARQAFIVDMVDDREDLSSAIALNSAVFNAGRFLGPALGGVLIATLGEGAVFLLIGLSYVAVIGALLAIRPKVLLQPAPTNSVFADLRAGLMYGLGSRALRSLLFLVGGASLFGVPFMVLLPILATRVLEGGPSLFGWLAATVGLGSLLGALSLAYRSPPAGLPRAVFVGSVLFSSGLLALAAAQHPALALPACFLTGFGVTRMKASANTLLQSVLEDGMRGRVMSLYAMAFIGVTPIGSLLVGFVAEHMGTQATIAVGGGATLLVSVLFAKDLPVAGLKVAPPQD